MPKGTEVRSGEVLCAGFYNCVQGFIIVAGCKHIKCNNSGHYYHPRSVEEESIAQRGSEACQGHTAHTEPC
jgi:hypothetical protein